MVTSTTDLEKRLEHLKRAVPTRGMERHPSILKDISELPAELKSSDLTDITARETILEIISFPQQIQRGHHYVPKQALLFTSTGIVHTLASIWPDQGPEVTVIRADSLIYLKVTLILLYGFLEIAAESSCVPTRLAVEFNTVAWDQIAPPIRQFLQDSRNTPTASIEKIPYSAQIQPALDALPLKFINGVRIYGILPGEALEELVFQPGTWEHRLLLFRQAILSNTLVLLTSNYVVVDQEELEVSQGWILSYIPRSRIASIRNQPCVKWNELIFNLKHGQQKLEYKILTTAKAAQAWGSSWVQHGGQWQDLPGS
jgi:hypothetical protein